MHVLQRILSLVAVGVELFFFSMVLKLNVFVAAGLHCWDKMEVTLKCFRAGRAPSLAAIGHSIGEILLAWEWKSSAFLKYCQAADLSVSALLHVVFADDPEDEQFGIDGDLWHTS